MDEKQIFNFIEKQKKDVLTELLKKSYKEMDTNQKRAVFGEIVEKIPPSKVNGEVLLDEIKIFQKDSLNGIYYAPFDINSKNFTHIPEETEKWFEKINDLLLGSMRLTEQNDHQIAVDCFSILFDLIDKMEDGEEIIFADEYGSWMIPGDEKIYIKAYLTSLAAVKTPEEYTITVLPMIHRDSYCSFANKVYSSAIKVASKEQITHLTAEVKRQKIKTKS